mgnify:CR=1 FL=1
MTQGVDVVGLYVRDQDEALAFYVEKLRFRVHTDVCNGDYRWLTVQHPDQPSFQLGLFTPGPPLQDDAILQPDLADRRGIAAGAFQQFAVLRCRDGHQCRRCGDLGGAVSVCGGAVVIPPESKGLHK